MFIPGQRWISDAESELGLGTVLTSNARQVTLVFMFSGETRIYATETAALTRVRFSPGDRIESHEGWFLTITSVEEHEGLLTYLGQLDNGQKTDLSETSLSNFIRLNKPQERLLSGQTDDNRWFELRALTLNKLHKLSHSPVHGLRGARIDVIPHQIYIANEVGSRSAPRVLLADEVGLGKTIEAGLILHYKLLREEISRVLIVVPEPLLHQWLVEMQRRFNLRFQIMDGEKYRSIKHENETENPFSTAQLILCSLPFLMSSDDVQKDTVDAGWDTLIVDEAHHLGWQESGASSEYELIDKLASIIPSVLLLTATPEQLGQAGHFARLRLLDKDRFGSLSGFLEETTHYREIADIATRLHENQPLEQTDVLNLKSLLGKDFLLDAEWRLLMSEGAEKPNQCRQNVLERMIDQHGTGRLLFRNTRSAIQGFPGRFFHYHELPTNLPVLDALSDWLRHFVRDLYPQKTLMICSSFDTVLDLAELLRVRYGLHVAVFHEKMSIVERDRAAAWFSSPEDDCPLMISSEIGSEGRNFQFLHHLVLHELPRNPDLLEQRIGRLDRIGQNADIQIHVPCQAGSVDDKLAHWYHHGLHAFEKTSVTGSVVARQFVDELDVILQDDQGINKDALINLTNRTRQFHQTQETLLEHGRDRLLELNSNRPEKIGGILESLAHIDNDPELQEFLARVFDGYGVDFEEQSDGSWIVQPGHHMAVSTFPTLPNEGLTLTFNRSIALAREDLTYLSWDHPMISGAMDLLISSTKGQACVSICSLTDRPQGALLVEALFRVDCTISGDSALKRYLPAETLRLVIDESGRDVSVSLQADALCGKIEAADKSQTGAFIKARAPDIRSMIETATTLANKQVPDFRVNASLQIKDEYNAEVDRLKHLQTFNRLIRDEEISTLEQRRDGLLASLEGVASSLVALRVLVNIH